MVSTVSVSSQKVVVAKEPAGLFGNDGDDANLDEVFLVLDVDDDEAEVVLTIVDVDVVAMAAN